jgi:MGT family glycosyltransferase
MGVIGRAGRFLVVVWDGGGNVVPAVGLAAALVGGGHDVRALGPVGLGGRFEAVGARYGSFRRAVAPPVGEADVSEDNLLGWTRFISGRRLAEDVLEELGAEGTDVAVVDAFLSGGLAAAERAGVAAVPLVHVLYAPCVVGPVATQWDSTRPMVDVTRRRLKVPGIDPGVPVMAGLWSRCPLVLVGAPRRFDFPCVALPGNARYVGPMLAGPGPGVAPGPWVGRGRVLVSFSTTAMRQRDVIQRSLDALASVDVEVVCTLGGVSMEGLSVPANASVFDWVPHRELLPATDVVVTHGGLSTVLAALAAGVPMVCMPMGRDQPLNAERVAALGLGVDLSPEASAGAIRDAVRLVLGDGSFRDRARSMAEDIAGYGNGKVAVQELESLL